MPKNTLQVEKTAETLLLCYLEEQQPPNTDYWSYPDDKLDKILVKFWFSLRKKESNKYTVSTLQNIKNGLNRSLQRWGRHLDISKDTRYAGSHWAFKDACKELKSEGLGFVKNFPEIEKRGEQIICVYYLLQKLARKMDKSTFLDCNWTALIDLESCIFCSFRKSTPIPK